MSLMDQEVKPPRDNKGQKIAVSTTGARTALASHLLGPGWIRVKAVTANVDILFGNASVAIPVHGATGSTGVGYPILAGTWEEFYITNDTYISYDADANGVLAIWRLGRDNLSDG